MFVLHDRALLYQAIRPALAALDDALAQAGHPLPDEKPAALSLEELQSAASEAGLVLPLEAEQLWLWRNGTGRHELPGGLTLLSFDEVIEDHRWRHSDFPYEDFPEIGRAWFVGLRSGSNEYWIHGGAAHAGPVPVTRRFSHDSESAEELAASTAGSITGMIHDMTGMLVSGKWTKTTSGRWELAEPTSLNWLAY